jgi:hypothetical protein
MDYPASQAQLGWRQYLLGFLFGLLSASVLSGRLVEHDVFSHAAYAAGFGIFLLALRDLGLREFYLNFCLFGYRYCRHFPH